jgi:hypothetical protein
MYLSLYTVFMYPVWQEGPPYFRDHTVFWRKEVSSSGERRGTMKTLIIPGDQARFEPDVSRICLDGIDIASSSVLLVSYGYLLTSEPSQGRAARRWKSLSRTELKNGCSISCNISFFVPWRSCHYSRHVSLDPRFCSVCFFPLHCDFSLQKVVGL